MSARSRSLAAVVALAVLGALARAQTVQPLAPLRRARIDTGCLPHLVRPAAPWASIDLGPYVSCAAGSTMPWSAAFTPDGAEAYVSLLGGTIGASGCEIARIDPATRVVLGTLPVDEGPEEIVFTTDASGAWRHGWVSCSSASTVVAFDTARQVVASVPIPFDSGSGWSTAFPFGLAVSPDQSRVYVGTLDGSGRIWVIDTASFALLPAETIALGADHGHARMLFHEDELVVTTTHFHAGFQGSTAEIVFVDPASPGSAVRVELATSSDSSLFPSPQDCALLCDGRLFVAGFDMGAAVHVLDARSRTLLRTIPTWTTPAEGKFQALGLSPLGLLGVGDVYSSELALFDAWSERWLGIVDAAAHGSPHWQPGEIAFSGDGRELWMPCTGSANLAVLLVP